MSNKSESCMGATVGVQRNIRLVHNEKVILEWNYVIYIVVICF